MNRVSEYQELCAELYQVLGALDAPPNVLDKVLAAANGEPIPDIDLLPFAPEANSAHNVDAGRPAPTLVPEDVRELLERSALILGSQGCLGWDQLAAEITAKLAEASQDSSRLSGPARMSL